jgi:phage/plasmid-like protein (TIGR03299 family)
MSHGITLTDSMAYVGELPWHGLGTYCGDEAVSAKEMLVRAGLDWQVELRPALYKHSDGSVREVDGRRAIVRLGEHETALGVVGSRYVPVQNVAMFDVLDALAAEGAKLHTAGSLWGGRQVWAMAQLPLGFTVKRRDGGEDAHASFLAVFGSHDGSGSVLLKPTDVRVVCANTRGYALSDGLQSVSVRHTASAASKLDALARVLGDMPAAVRADAEVLGELAAAPMSMQDAVLFSATVIAGLRAESRANAAELLAEHSDAQSDASRSRLDNQVAEVLRYFQSGTGNAGESRYDALNALTEWIDHKRATARNAADRHAQASRAMESAVDGTGADRKRRAVQLLTRW